MKEIEIKILEINTEEIRKKLLNLGAKKTFEGELEIVKLDFPDGKLKKEGKLLRVRKVGTEIELCFKGEKEPSSFKVQEELQVISSDFNTTIRIFENLGFNVVFRGTKQRESYKLNNISFEIDSWGIIPSLLEIEAPTENEVLDYVHRLGFSLQQTTKMDEGEVEEYYQNKNDRHQTT